MHGVAERIKDGSDIDVEVRAVTPDISGWYYDELGETAIAVNARAFGVGAKLPTSGATVAAATAHDMTLNADEVTDVDAVDAWADRFYVPGDLMSHDDGWSHHRLRRGVPRPNVEVSPPDPGPRHPDETSPLPGSAPARQEVPGLGLRSALPALSYPASDD